ncbi:hypothetical protein Q5P01_016573 [Channa striata]|uniref:G-protein coupled receptors family 1 profile domain-containing protein n=1 Tax=Channa striata TaxID=64152 RepID=A0AA88SAL4_CHASR|nr:hypothetical protein Q5P01_016573 [Channa striata]
MAYGGGNITFYNQSEGTANGSAASAFDYCHSLYLHSRILVPSLHAVVTTVGLSINLYTMLVLFRNLRRPSTGSLTRSGSLRGVSWNFQYFLFHIGLCDICMLSTIPVWITQTVFAKGWIFGYTGCKVVKGLITVQVRCPVTVFTVINVSMAVGNMHCVMTPAMYLVVRARRANLSQTSRTESKSFSLRK